MQKNRKIYESVAAELDFKKKGKTFFSCGKTKETCHQAFFKTVLRYTGAQVDQTYEPRCEKTGLRGFRPGPTQTRLYSHRRWLEA